MGEQDLNLYWKTVVDTIQDGVMIVDTDGTIVSVNRGFEEISGYSADDILGRSCAVLSCSSCELVRQQQGCHFCVMFQKGRLRRQRCAITRKDGTTRHVVKNASVLKDHDGTVTGAVETLTDVTDLIDKEAQIENFRRELQEADRFHGMIGTSPAMQKVFEMITNAAQSDAPVTIQGESGTGKELMAQAIHEAGRRAKKPFVKVNCAALNQSLLESELFGHVKGAFTGAHRTREGRFEAANGGDIFLDEIGDLPLSTQVKLLRVIEDKVVERVGDNRPIHANVRIISATNRDLRRLIDSGSFREDFYYRINVIPIPMPPLRDRTGDIPLLAQAFFQCIRLKTGKPIQGISRDALTLLAQYHWPGNVRELKSAFEYAFVACTQETIQPEHLPPAVAHAVPQTPSESIKGLTMEEIKKNRLREALMRSGGNQSEAARLLGISRTSVWQQIKRYGLMSS